MKVKAARLLFTMILCFAILSVSTLAIDKAGAADATSKQSIPFTAVAEETAYADAVRWAVENGVAIGMNDGTFAPDAVCTRAQMITFLRRAAGSHAVNYYMPYTPFADVPTDAWYTNAVLWAASEGIISGGENSLFEPNAGCTKA